MIMRHVGIGSCLDGQAGARADSCDGEPSATDSPENGYTTIAKIHAEIKQIQNTMIGSSTDLELW